MIFDRLLTTGTIEEKIYQRQISKTGLSEAVIDANLTSSLKFSANELKVYKRGHINQKYNNP